MIRVTVEFWGPARDLAQPDAIHLELPDSARVGDARTALTSRFARMRIGGRLIRLAVNEAFADDSHSLRDGDVILAIPPVSGG